MKTQIVYVLVSSEKDVFLEELWVSVWSLRQHEPDVIVNVVVDEPTAKRVKANAELMTLITNVVVADVPEKYTPKERSREIKTRIRELIKGDFFYIDTEVAIYNMDGISSNHRELLYREHCEIRRIAPSWTKIIKYRIEDAMPVWLMKRLLNLS